LGENPPAITGEQLSDYAASWEGYTEAFSFASGTDRLRLTLAEDGTGTIIVGEDAPPPPVPTNPEVGPGFATGRQLQPLVLEGFPFSVQAIRVEARRLRLGAELKEPYRAWCELQTAYPIAPDIGYYECLPNGSTRSNGDRTDCALEPEGTDEWIPIDCEKLSLCMAGAQTCRCDEAGCSIPASESLEAQSLHLDGALFERGAEMVGTLVLTEHGGETVRASVRFIRE
jgi:hypothetical protein